MEIFITFHYLQKVFYVFNFFVTKSQLFKNKNMTAEEAGMYILLILL